MSHMLHGAGIFTHMTGWFLGQMLVNIPYMEHMGVDPYKCVSWFSDVQRSRRGNPSIDPLASRSPVSQGLPKWP